MAEPGRPRVRVLGAMTVEIDGQPADLGGPRQRAVLGLLVAARGATVSAARLVDEIWGENPPGDPGGTLQSYVSHLRRALEPGAAARARSTVLVREGRGYACRLAADAVDAWQFEDLVRQGAGLGESPAAVAPLRAALDLWRGRPFADHAGEPWADTAAGRWEALRALALEQLAAGRLAAGESVALIPDLEAMVEADPLREDRWRLLATALYRSGRQADALAALRRARGMLAESLGVDPGPGLRALEAQILAHDPALSPQDRVDDPRPAEPPAPPVVSAELIDRVPEIAALTAAVEEALTGSGGPVLIQGPAGIGKTRLMAEVRRLGAGRGARVLTGRGSPLEREFAFGVVRQLLEPLVSDQETAERLLDGAALAAAPVFGLAETATGVDLSFAVLQGLYWMVVRATEFGPLVLAVDDLQWCDAGTLRFLAFLARRMTDLPILVIATHRTGEQHTDEAALADLAQADPVVIEPRPLSRQGVATLVGTRLGEPDPAFVTACARTTGGNPLLVRQLLRALEAERVPPDGTHVDRVLRIGSRAVSNSVLRRLDLLGPHVVQVARTVAVLGDGCSLPALAALAGLPEDLAAHAADQAAAAEILRDAHPLGFVHPVVRDAVYQAIPAIGRGLAHDQAARLLAAAEADPEQVAAQLLLAPPRADPWAVTQLRAAAVAAQERGSPSGAARYLTRALAEPPPAADQPALLAELGLVQAFCDGTAAIANLTAAYRQLPAGPLAAEVAAVAAQAMIFSSSPGQASTLAFAAARSLPADLSDARQRLEAVARMGGYMHALDPELWRDGPARLEGNGLGARLLTATQAWHLQMSCRDRPEAVRLARFALDGMTVLKADPGLFPMTASLVLSCADEPLDEFWAATTEFARSRGSLFTALSVNLWQGHYQWWHGDLRDAETSLRTAMEQSVEWESSPLGFAYTQAFLAQVRLDRGDLAGARAVLAESDLARAIGEGRRLLLEARARVLLAEGRLLEALEVTTRMEGLMPYQQNPAFNQWRSIQARIRFLLGQQAEAERLIEQDLELATSWGAPRLLGRVRRLRGRIRGAAGHADLRTAVELLESVPAPAERAKALAELARREDRPAAAGLLTRAVEVARACGADGVERDCIRRLIGIAATVPPQPSGLDGLTGTQRQALTLHGEGMPITQIAELLQFTPTDVRRTLDAARSRLGTTDDAALLAAAGPGRGGS